MTELRAEAEGETVGEAKWAALRELERRHPGLDKGSVRFQVITEGQRGLLGVGYAPARVVAAIDEPESPEPARVVEPVAAADPGDQPARAREVVQRVVAGLGVDAEVSVREREGEIHVTCTGSDLGVLIGRHGHTIDAIQYLVNAILARSGGEGRAPVVVDAAGYRARRSAALEALATRGAQRALALGETVALEPMTAIERKVVHLHLQDEPGIETASEGAEPNRYVVIRPAPSREPTSV